MAEQSLPITIKRIRNARNLRLRVLDTGQIVVTAPFFLSEQEIANFIETNKDWVNEKLEKISVNQESLTANRDTLLLRGKVFQFRLDVNSVKKPGVNVNSDKIIVTSPNEEHEKVRQILEIWYRKEAEKHFKDRLPLLADLVGKDIKTVSIRSQRTRWGSRSSRGTVSLNWRLIMAPDTVSDYVIYHELAHITQMNHSKRFWDLVETYCADYKTAERWLKEHHGLLKF